MPKDYSLTFTNGYVIFIEGNDPSGREWWIAHEWQKNEFIKVMRFGEMKSMGAPNPLEETEPFNIGSFQYRFIIENDWGPCYLHNMTTDKKRRIQYIQLGPASETNTTSQVFIHEH